MPATIDYYFAPISPFTYLAGDELEANAPAKIRYHPVDLPLLFAETGGIPLGQRSKQRLDYRMAELHRIAAKREMEINFNPAFFPVNPSPATKLLLAARDAGEDVGALLRALLKAVWREERDIANDKTLLEILAEQSLPESLLATSTTLNEQLEQETREAAAAGVFGAPFYIVNGEPFWGQDRLADALALAKKLS